MASTRPKIDHVLIAVMENEEFNVSTFKTEAPFLWSLANPEGTGKYAFLSQYFSITHPSLPNYLSLTGGSTFGVVTDCQPSECPQNSMSIAGLLDRKRLSWKEYAESMPAPCGKVVSGKYYPKHNPFVYFTEVTNSAAYCASHVVPLGDVNSKSGPFFDDLGSGSLPNYSFITPNICDDAHDCPLSAGDAWLKTFLSNIINNEQTFKSTVIFIVFDEGTTNAGFRNVAGGQVYAAVLGPANIVIPGAVSKVQYSHYSTLATIEAIFSLGNLGRNDSTASIMGSDVFIA